VRGFRGEKLNNFNTERAEFAKITSPPTRNFMLFILFLLKVVLF